MTPADQRLVRAAMALRATNAPAWNEFRAAVNDHVELVKINCIASPPEQILVAQGQARHAITFLGILDSAPAEYEKMRGK
jgi:hypothetical protein